MFDTLSDRLQATLGRLRGQGRLTEAQVDTALRDVRLALLEADVNFRVVKDFVARVRVRAVGEEVLKSLAPAQQVVKVVHEELVRTLGEEHVPLAIASRPPTVVLMAGLQGAGKTSTTAKLARWLLAKGHRPLLVACDLQRPAAVQQLRMLGEQVGVPVFAPDAGAARLGGVGPSGAGHPGPPGQAGATVVPGDPVQVALDARAEADRTGRDVVLVDTAGRLSIDEELMAQAAAIRDAVRADEVLLVLDAMTGQDAVQTAEAFTAGVGATGVILTKLDGDARGGAALSVTAVTGLPIKFAATGEKPADFDAFHPDRLAGRILGMGDMLTLIERAQETVDVERAAELEEKVRKASFTLEDFLDQLQQIKRMGPLQQVLGMLPGVGAQLKDTDVDERELGRVEAIIYSMTPAERNDPKILNGSRRARVARGSGTTPQQVNNLLKQFVEMRKMMQQLSAATGGGRRGLRGLGGMLGGGMPGAGGGLPGGMGGMPGTGGMAGLPGGGGGGGRKATKSNKLPKRKQKGKGKGRRR